MPRLTRIFSHRGSRLLLQLAVVSGVLGAAAVAGAATTGVFSGSAGATGKASVTPSFQVLKGPIVSLPPGSMTPILERVGGQLGVVAHRALVASDGSQLFAVTSRDGQYLCLTVNLADGTIVNTCDQLSGLQNNEVVWIKSVDPGGRTFDLYGLAPDGITAVRAGMADTTPMNNAFAITGIPVSVSDLAITGQGIRGSDNLGFSPGAPSTPATTTTTSS